MIVKLDHTQPDEAEMLWYLQRLAFAVEARIIGFDKIPPLMETIAAIQASTETFCGIFEDDELIAAVSYERAGDEVTICRVMVHPEHFRKGLASRLLTHVEQAEPDAGTFRVSTGERNEPAVRLYRKHGYFPIGTQEIAPGVELLHVQKNRSIVK